jgi:hypothetical protein
MKEKDFYSIAEMSDDFKMFEQSSIKRNIERTDMTEIQLWQARFMLAIAQQLSVVSAHLGKIVRKAEDLNGKD